MEYAKENKILKNSNNSFFRLLCSLGIIFSIANIVAIYNFFKILVNM